jgi:hypothetical protein
MNNRVDIKVQSKVKSLESEHVMHPPGVGKFGEGVTPIDGDI